LHSNITHSTTTNILKIKQNMAPLDLPHPLGPSIEKQNIYILKNRVSVHVPKKTKTRTTATLD
jgi:hypothetical protein